MLPVEIFNTKQKALSMLIPVALALSSLCLDCVVTSFSSLGLASLWDVGFSFLCCIFLGWLLVSFPFLGVDNRHLLMF